MCTKRSPAGCAWYSSRSSCTSAPQRTHTCIGGHSGPGSPSRVGVGSLAGLPSMRRSGRLWEPSSLSLRDIASSTPRQFSFPGRSSSSSACLRWLGLPFAEVSPRRPRGGVAKSSAGLDHRGGRAPVAKGMSPLFQFSRSASTCHAQCEGEADEVVCWTCTRPSLPVKDAARLSVDSRKSRR